MSKLNPTNITERFADITKRLAKPKAALVLAAALIGIVLVAGVLGASGPRDAAIKQAIEEACADLHPSAGEFDAEGAWKIESVDIVSKKKQNVDAAFVNSLGDIYYEVSANVSATNGHAESEKSVTCNFVHYQGAWQLMADPGAVSATWHALEGPDAKKIAASAGRVLQRADNENGSYELQPLYKDVTPKVEDLAFDEDAQTASATLRFERTDAFSSSTATIRATFAFEQGSWALKSAQEDASAAGESYDKLVGTWKGAFASTVATKGNCFGAQDRELVIKITSVDAASGKVEGTFQGLVHYHAFLDADANGCEGDTDTGEIPFVATLAEGEVIDQNYEGMVTTKLGASYTAPETADGKVRISFGFGTKDDANAAMAKLTTKANKAKGYRDSALYEDTYTLTKVEE